MEISEAIKTLDATDDSLWTGEGLPRIDLVAKLVEKPLLTRKEVTEAAPDFTRELALKLQAPEPPADATPDQPTVPPADVTPEDPPVDKVKAAKDKVDDASRRAEEANQVRLAAEKDMDAAIMKEEETVNPHADRDRNQFFLRSQQEQRAKRNRTVGKALKLLNDLDTRAPVDRIPQRRRMGQK